MKAGEKAFKSPFMQDNNFFENKEVLEQEKTDSLEKEKIEESAAEQVIYNTVNRPYNFIPAGLTAETYEEKKKVKKAANTVGSMLLTFFGFVLIFNLLIIAFSYGFSGNESFKAFISDPAVNQFVQMILSASLFTFPFIFIAKIGNIRISDIVNFKKPEKGLFLPLFLFGAAACSFANIAVSYAGNLFEKFGINYSVDYGDNPKGIFGFLLSLISTAIVPALVEEFAFRGLIMGILRRFGDGFAVITSAVLFGIMHGNFEQMPFAFLVGLSLGFIAIKSGSIWTAVAVHFFNNLISVLIDYALSGFSSNIKNVIYTFFLIVILLLGIVALTRFKNSEDMYKFEHSGMESKEKQKYKWFFSSPTIIIFMIIFLIESLTFFVF